LCKMPIIFSSPSCCSQIWNFLPDFHTSPLRNYTKIRPVRDALIYTDRHDKADSCFSWRMGKRLESGMNCEPLKQNIYGKTHKISRWKLTGPVYC
jgi:hypothetical protein